MTIDTIFLSLVVRAAEATDTGFFARNLAGLEAAWAAKNVLAIMTNPFVLAATALMVAFGMWVRSSKVITLALAFWGYALSYHYSWGTHTESISTLGDFEFNELVPIVVFTFGFLASSIAIIYFVFYKD
ncbi:hypothetical protein K8I61_16145 [bacterium]|nr:hypothetical protein [bacterium]